MPSPESSNVLDAYRGGVAALEAAVAVARDIDAVRAPGEWSTRMIVHHLADGEALWLHPLKLALLHDGFDYHHNVWLQEGSGEALAYGARDMSISLALFRAQREHAGSLLDAIPHALTRHVMLAAEGRTHRVTVEDILKMQIGHLASHISEMHANQEATAQST